MVAGVETMVSGRDLTPWHRNGEVVKGLMTADQCLKKSGLDWEVRKIQGAVVEIDEDGNQGEVILAPGKFGTVRVTDKKVLGLGLGKIYEICQNRDGFAFLDHLAAHGEAAFDTAGSLFGGKRVWISMILNKSQRAAGDEYVTYLVFSNTHDGSRGITCLITKVRIVCANTETMAFREAITSWSIAHRTTMEGQLQAAREQLNIAVEYDPVFEKAVEAMAKKQVTDDAFREIMLAEFPEQKRQRDANIEAVLLNRKTSETIADDMRPTALGAYHAFTEWVDHIRDYRTGEARMKNVLLGQGASFRNGVGGKLLELAR